MALFLYGLGLALMIIAESIDAKWLNWPAGVAMLAGLLHALWIAVSRILVGARNEVRHVARHGLAQQEEAPGWIRLPFASEVLIAMYGLALTPIGLSIERAYHGRWLESAGFAGLWLLVFPIVALNLHRQRLLHIGVSIFAAAAAVVALPLAILLIE